LQQKVKPPTRIKWSKVTVLYAGLLLVGVGLFSERYLVNIAQYHTPIPECNQVLSVDDCQGYAPWARNYMYESWHIKLENKDVARYPFTWVNKALGETVFTITSRFNERRVVDYYAATQLVVPNVLSWVFFIGGGLLAIWNWRFIRSQKTLWVLLGVSAVYVLALFSQNLLDYLHLGIPIAIHGRYLLPLMPLLFLCVAYGVRETLRSLSKTQTIAASRAAILTIVTLVIFAIEGGGFVTLIVRSHDDWFWPQSRPSQLVNQYARDALKHVVVDY
jgi:hypothetical protein